MNFKEWFLIETSLEERLIKAGQEHLRKFPDPDYGRLWWHPHLKKVHWVFGDGAGGWKEGEKVFRAIKGVKDVEMADEYSPKKENGWVRLL